MQNCPFPDPSTLLISFCTQFSHTQFLVEQSLSPNPLGVFPVRLGLLSLGALHVWVRLEVVQAASSAHSHPPALLLLFFLPAPSERLQTGREPLVDRVPHSLSFGVMTWRGFHILSGMKPEF